MKHRNLKEESSPFLQPAAAAYLAFRGYRTPRPASPSSTGLSPQSVSINLGAIPKTRAASSSSSGLSDQEAVSEPLPATLQSEIPARPQSEVQPRCGLLCRRDLPVNDQNRLITVCNSCYRRFQTITKTLTITDIRDCNRKTRVAVSRGTRVAVSRETCVAVSHR